MFDFYKKYRSSKEFRKFSGEVRSIRHRDDDILSAEKKHALDALIAENHAITADPTADRARILETQQRRFAAILPPRRGDRIREWVDIAAVAFAVAFGVRGLYLQPFKIPTSSMQPTLYGIHFVEKERLGSPLMNRLPYPLSLLESRKARLEIASDGTLDDRTPRASGGKTVFSIGETTYQLPGTPAKVFEYSRIMPGREYRKGEVLCDGILSTGDHLFVDRVSFVLTGLKRGDVVVFNTEGIYINGGRLSDQSGFYYIKRLVGLPGDTLKITGQGLFVKPRGESQFRHITAFSKAFDKLYSGKGGYQGHISTVGDAPGNHLRTPTDEFTVPDGRYFMLGDNALFSADSRLWGTVPRRNIVGKALFIFWPLSRRLGAIDRQEPLDLPTGESFRGTFPSMYQQ
ncbi:MAG: signal peptidase I [Victivallaceae bacterium]|nr:signal peptidase I [Victivallaceae bacterium]